MLHSSSFERLSIYNHLVTLHFLLTHPSIIAFSFTYSLTTSLPTPPPPPLAGEHDPVEDARAALDLALLKFERGPGYGAASTERGEKLVEVLGSAGRWERERRGGVCSDEAACMECWLQSSCRGVDPLTAHSSHNVPPPPP